MLLRDYIFMVMMLWKKQDLKPSSRGELEITDLNRLYLQENRLKIKIMGRGMAWLDTGTHETLLQASVYVQTIEERQGLKVSCIEEIAYKQGYINRDQLLSLAKPLTKNQYGKYLMKIAEEKTYNFEIEDDEWK